jgi:hypothetical protein
MLRRSFARWASFVYDSSNIITFNKASQQYFEFPIGKTWPQRAEGITASKIIPIRTNQ